MGLFDTIRIKVTCPTCGTADEDVQTKALEPAMRTLHVGDLLPDEGFELKEGWIHGIGYCPRFSKTYDLRILVREGRITNQWEHVRNAS